MYLAGIQLNAVSLVNLTMALGIAVEFCAHPVHAFLEARGTRPERSAAALRSAGAAVLSGITVTKFIGVNPSSVVCVDNLCLVPPLHSVLLYSANMLPFSFVLEGDLKICECLSDSAISFVISLHKLRAVSTMVRAADMLDFCCILANSLCAAPSRGSGAGLCADPDLRGVLLPHVPSSSFAGGRPRPTAAPCPPGASWATALWRIPHSTRRSGTCLHVLEVYSVMLL